MSLPFVILQPAWWDAISNVPPMHHQPRVRKNEIPAITFAEDRLIKYVLPSTIRFFHGCSHLHFICRKFNRKNPAIFAFDKPVPSAADPRPIAQMFVGKQLEAMQNDMTEKEAYAVARAWMLENGPELFERLNVSQELKDVLDTTPDNIAITTQAIENTLQNQLRDVRDAFRAYEEDSERDDTLSVGGKKYIVGSYRSFMSSEEEDKVRSRAFSTDRLFPRGKGYDTEDESPVGLGSGKM